MHLDILGLDKCFHETVLGTPAVLTLEQIQLVQYWVKLVGLLVQVEVAATSVALNAAHQNQPPDQWVVLPFYWLVVD